MTLLARPSGVQLRIQGDLVDVLERCRPLRAEGSRQTLADILSDTFREVVSLRTQAPVREQFLDLVRYCGRQLSGLHRLVQAISVLAPREPEVSQLTILCDEWEATKILPAADWHELRGALLAIHLTTNETQERQRLRGLVHRATGGRVDLPTHCSSVWATFLFMAGTNSAAGSAPPAMTFLYYIAEQISDALLADWLRDWSHRWAEETSMKDFIDTTLRHTAESDIDLSIVYLVIQVDIDPTDNDSYAVSSWRHWDSQGWQMRRVSDAVVNRADLEREVDRLVSELEVELGSKYEASGIFLEFVVPWEMMNTPVEYWRKRSMSHDTVPLALDHPVVLRSLDRIRAARHRLAWKRRWNSLSGRSLANRHYWSQPSGVDYFSRLAAELSSDEQIVSLVLSEPPGDRDGAAWREAAMAFHVGIPAIIWDREDCSASLFREAVATLLGDGAVGQLPQRIANLRRDALRIDFRHRHPGRSIAILFDDPDRLPEPPSTWWISPKGSD